MKIGIGITTYNRPECLDKCVHQILTHTPQDGTAKLFIATDTDSDRKGIAFRKNECLRALKDCDHIFLFDDDCWPIKDGWIDFFIDAHKTSSHSHFLFLNEQHKKKETINYLTTKPKESDGKQFDSSGETSFAGIEIYSECGGCFMFITRQDLERVGAFNEKFTPYGFEHCDWSRRCIGSHGNYNAVLGTEKYLHSEDYSNPKHKSSITDEEKKKHVRNNWNKFFSEPIKAIHIPL